MREQDKLSTDGVKAAAWLQLDLTECSGAQVMARNTLTVSQNDKHYLPHINHW